MGDSFNDALTKFGRLIARMLNGVGSLTVENYTSVNSKRGVQYEASLTSSISSGDTAYFTIQVGASDVIIKDLTIQFTSEEITSTLFKNPTGVTGGTEITVYNLNDRDAVPDDVVITAGVSVSGEGTQVGPSIRSLGTGARINRQISNVGQNNGIERVLAAGNTYLYKVENTADSGSAEVSSVFTWYQGEIEVKQ